MTRSRQTWWPAMVAGLLLAGIGAQRAWTQSSLGDAEPYHQRIREAAATVPLRIGEWVGVDAPVPPAALTLLKPNVIISRHYLNLRTGLQVGLLLVQCRDARDMGGHYPPACYPGQGWALSASQSRDWQVRDRVIPGKEYEFLKQGPSPADVLIVGNFLIVPDGAMVRDMSSIRQIASHYTRRHFGAAQVQVAFPGRTSSEVRDRALQEIVSGVLPLILTIESRGER